MCLKSPAKMPAPPPPPPSAAPVLEQDAPTRTKSAKSSLQKKKSGTKAYRSVVGAQLGGINKKNKSPINV